MPHISTSLTQWNPALLQVYGIVACQLVLTAMVAALVMFNHPVQTFVLQNVAFQIINMLIPFGGARGALLSQHQP